MAVRPCLNSTPCLGDEPLDNFSSEADDSLDYISTKYAPGPPLIGRLWDKTVCGDTFVSRVSQADADQQAQAAANSCGNNNCATDCGSGTTFCNGPQTPCVPCPDGSFSCYRVAGGVFCGYANQETADSVAFEFGFLQARAFAICLSQITTCACINKAYSSTLHSSLPGIWTFSGGSLPPGLTFQVTSSSSAVISGVPTSNGQYTFQITVESAEGTFTTHTYTISVIEITTTQLPAFSIGVPYSFQLQAAGGSGNYQWKIAAGSLPNGLVLDNTGLIHGTPT